MKNDLSKNKMNIAAIILTAGKGKRVVNLGEKPFLKLKGKTFIEIAVDKAQKAYFQPIIVVTNKMLVNKVKNLNLNIEVIINPHPENGMLSSICCGLERLSPGATGFLLNPVDFPFVRQETYQKLWELHPQEKDCVIKPVYNGKSGHPVIFPSVVFDDLKKAPLNEGARSVLRKYPHLIREIEVDDPGIMININTVQMYVKHCLPGN